MNPGPPYVSIAAYFAQPGARAGRPRRAFRAREDTPFGNALARFVDADTPERDRKFKMVCALMDAPWALRSVVPRRPVILGKKTELRYHRATITSGLISSSRRRRSRIESTDRSSGRAAQRGGDRVHDRGATRRTSSRRRYWARYDSIAWTNGRGRRYRRSSPGRAETQGSRKGRHRVVGVRVPRRTRGEERWTRSRAAVEMYDMSYSYSRASRRRRGVRRVRSASLSNTFSRLTPPPRPGRARRRNWPVRTSAGLPFPRPRRRTLTGMPSSSTTLTTAPPGGAV